jgi:hypothetical protein
MLACMRAIVWAFVCRYFVSIEQASAWADASSAIWPDCSTLPTMTCPSFDGDSKFPGTRVDAVGDRFSIPESARFFFALNQAAQVSRFSGRLAQLSHRDSTLSRRESARPRLSADSPASRARQHATDVSRRDFRSRADSMPGTEKW